MRLWLAAGEARSCGGVAEWLRQGPAKPCTRVRFPSPPLIPCLGIRCAWRPDRSCRLQAACDPGGVSHLPQRCIQPQVRQRPDRHHPERSSRYMVIAVTYPSARISFLLLFSRSATRGIDVVVPRPVARQALLPDCRPRPRRPMRFPPSAGPARNKTAMSRGQISSTLLARTYPRPPISTCPSAPRSVSLRSPPGSARRQRPRKAAGRGGSRARPVRRPAADSAGKLTPPGGDVCRLRLALPPGPARTHRRGPHG